MYGKFITFEGGEGAGKTTIINALKDLLEQDGYSVMVTREPGGVKIAEQIRSVILDNNNTEMDGRTEALLYAAARRQHLVEKVLPALEKGVIVLSDRFVDSSLAYQGHARNLGINEVLGINLFAIDETMPDLTLFLDIEPELGLERVLSRSEALNRLDLETNNFHKNVYEGYKMLEERFKDRIINIDASLTLDEVLKNVYDEVKKALLK